jgi:hypothetical protein
MSLGRGVELFYINTCESTPTLLLPLDATTNNMQEHTG